MIRRIRRGSAAIEFALWLPVLFFLLSAVVDWGAYWATRVTIARATMDGTRRGSATFEPDTMPDGSTVTPGSLVVPAAEARAATALQAMFGSPCGSCVITGQYCPANTNTAACRGDETNGPPFDAVVLRIDYPFAPYFGFSSTPTMITEEFLMAVERQR